MTRICTLCLETDHRVISMINTYPCGCRFDFHPQCFEVYQQNNNMCLYCRNGPVPPVPTTSNQDNFREDWTRLMRFLNRVQNRYIIASECNDQRYLHLINHINVLQNNMVSLILTNENNNI